MFVEENKSGVNKFTSRRHEHAKSGAQNQSVRSTETQRETLVFVSHYLNRLAAFILNVFPSKIFAMMLLLSEC